MVTIHFEPYNHRIDGLRAFPIFKKTFFLI